MTDDLTIYEVLERSRNDPDNSPGKPAKQGMWTWWRTGPHPEGVWQAMDWNQPGWGVVYRENEDRHKPMQDRALSESSDFGNVSCHACGKSSEGYPEPRHKTACDGVCKRENCPRHPTPDVEKQLLIHEIAALRQRLEEARARLEDLS